MWLHLLVIFCLYKLVDYLVRRPILTYPKGKVRAIFITGCDTGFGNGLAKRLDEKGFTVFAGCYTENGRERLQKDCSNRMKGFPLDVTNMDSIKKALAFVQENLPPGGLWAVVNNAGIVPRRVGPHDWFDHNIHYREVFDVNMYGLLNTTMTFLPLLKKSQGRIVNVTSLMGRMPIQYATPYAASKYAAECISDIHRREFRRYKISLHIIEPGFTATHLLANVADSTQKAWDETSPETKQEYGGDFKKTGPYKMWNHTMPVFTDAGMDPVLNDCEHALLGQFPRGRYLAGRMAKLLYPMVLLPEWLGDFIGEFLIEVCAFLNLK